MRESYIIDYIGIENNKIPKVSADLSISDKIGALLMRLSFNRNSYRVNPGLYAVGAPKADSIVLVSANYKLSFDALRKELSGLNVWIMVIDTKGINVWCAAGKGTFGTEEIVKRISETKLGSIVNHRKIIVPQLGAPGVSAHEVKAKSGFAVVYGPIKAKDIKMFVSSGMKATKEMREMRFTFYDRFVLTPVEFVGGFKYLIFVIALLFLLSGFNSNGYSVLKARANGINIFINLFAAYISGTILMPLLLPWLPGRAFALKGAFSGLIVFCILLFSGFTGNNFTGVLEWLFLITAVSSFIAMNFTGSSTYTSLSGVRKEMKTAVPLQAAFAVIGLVLWVIERFQ